MPSIEWSECIKPSIRLCWTCNFYGFLFYRVFVFVVRKQRPGLRSLVFVFEDLRFWTPFHNGLTPKRAEKPKLFLAEESNKCDRRITETLKENLVYEWRAFNRLIQRILPKRPGDIVFFSPCCEATKTCLCSVTARNAKNDISGSLWQNSLIQTVKCSPFIGNNFLETSCDAPITFI